MTTTTVARRWLVSRPDVEGSGDVFPYLPGQMFIQLKTPKWSTKTVTSLTGVERRRALWSYPVWKFTVAYEFLRGSTLNPEIYRLWDFFNINSGGFQDWNYFDPWDHEVTNEPFAVANGIKTDFQLTRTAHVGSKSFTEPIFRVVAPPTIYAGGVIIPAGYSVSPTGIISFDTPPDTGAVLSWTGQFFYRCRFSDDELSTQQMYDLFWSGDSINFQTFKE